MRLFAVVLFFCGAFGAWAADDAFEIVRRSLDRHEHNTEIAKDYTYREHSVVTQYDSNHRAKKSESTTHDIVWLYGRPYSRLVEKNDHPLSPGEERKQEQRMSKEMERRRKAAEQGDSRERRDYEKDRAEQRKMVEDILSAYSFSLAGDDVVDGMPVYVIKAEPSPEYKPHDMRTKMLPKLHGRLWIDKADYQWVRVEAQVIDTISIGLFLARLSPGSSLFFEQRRVNDELWLPSEARVKVDGRLAVLKKLRQEAVVTFSNYRKFQTDSRVVAVGQSAATK